MKTIVFLASGNGGNLKFINEAIKLFNFPIKIIGVVADRQCRAIDYAVKNNLDAEVLNFKIDDQKNVAQYLFDIKPDFVITNVHKVLNNNVLSYDKGTFINLHYSLLPAYAGLIGMKTVDCALQDNTMFIGVTCHLVNEKVDAGKILGQSMISTNWVENDSKHYYDGVFRSGCLVLLNQLLTNYSDQIQINKYLGYTINPPLKFEIEQLDDLFWEKIK